MRTNTVVGRPWLVALAAAAVAALALAACGSDQEAPGVATAATDGAAAPRPTATAGSVEEYVEGVRAYAECMRANGVPDFPDPGPRGEIEIKDLAKRKADPAFTRASKQCKGLHPPVPAELEQAEPLTAEQIANAKKYAVCMRANGVPDFRDPGPDGRFQRDEAGPPSDEAAAAQLRAGAICEPVLSGKPPATAAPADPGVG